MGRIELDAKLREVLGSTNVYFQPPESIKLKYPCIIYNLSSATDMHADDQLYRRMKRYSVTYITKNADDPKLDEIDNMRYCSFERGYAADNLYHFVYNIYN